MSSTIDAGAALALIADLYRQLTEARAQLDHERHHHAERTARLERQLDELRAAVRAEAGVPTDQP